MDTDSIAVEYGLVRGKRPNGAETASHAAGTAGDQSVAAAAEADGPDTGTGFGGRTVAEDTQAVRTGITPPPPVGRTTASAPDTQGAPDDQAGKP